MAPNSEAASHVARFISFEGGEGVGKSTQVKRLVAALARHAITAVRTREPGGTPKAEAIRSLILQGRSETWGPGAEAVLFAAARLDHVNQLIAPSLAAGKWVISDRFHDSTRAYQGLTGGVDEKLIRGLETLALDGHAPDLTIILDMEPAAAFERVAQRALEDGLAATGDRFEKEDLDWHRRLRDAFLEIAKANPERCVVIGADRSEDAIEDEIWKAVSGRFPELATGARA
ncbi:MAG: dTMP kinase [Devosia sp.]|nr:dTMP kinase [Devosia sp.]